MPQFPFENRIWDQAETLPREQLEALQVSRLRDTVEKIINNKFTDGQFEKCPITLQDLSKIAESIVVSLSGIYHARIEYQENTSQS